MANLLNQNPVILTGLMSSSYKGATATSLGTLTTTRVQQVRWRNPITVGDVLLITDPQDGTNLLRLRCITAGQDIVVDWSGYPRLWRDFQAIQVDSGEVSIYLC